MVWSPHFAIRQESDELSGHSTIPPFDSVPFHVAVSWLCDDISDLPSATARTENKCTPNVLASLHPLHCFVEQILSYCLCNSPAGASARPPCNSPCNALCKPSGFAARQNSDDTLRGLDSPSG